MNPRRTHLFEPSRHASNPPRCRYCRVFLNQGNRTSRCREREAVEEDLRILSYGY